MTHAMLAGDDRSTPARIRDAALECFAERGVKPTTVRQVAERAGVSPALVIHHFGSKEGLRSACDRRVVALIGERKRSVMQAGPGLDPLAALRDHPGDPPFQRYLARTLAEGTPEVAALVDEMVDDAERYLRDGMESGAVRRSDDPRGLAAVLMMWSLGALVLHEHVERVLGVDITGPAETHVSNPAYVRPALELLSRGIFGADRVEGMASAGRTNDDGEPTGSSESEEDG